MNNNLKKLYNYLYKKSFFYEANILQKVANETKIDFEEGATVVGIPPKIKKAIKELSKKTGHSEAVITELWVENKDAMQGLLFPATIEDVSVSVKRYGTVVVNGKLIDGKAVVLSESEYRGQNSRDILDEQQEEWPFSHENPGADSGYKFEENKAFYEKFSIEDAPDYEKAKLNKLKSRLKEQAETVRKKLKECNEYLQEAIKNNEKVKIQTYDPVSGSTSIREEDPRTYDCNSFSNIPEYYKSINSIKERIRKIEPISRTGTPVERKSRKSKPTANALYTSDGASNEYLINIGCGYYYITNFSDNNIKKPIIVKLSTNQVNTIIKGEASFFEEAGYSNQFTYYASKNDLNAEHRAMIKDIKGCDIKEILKKKDPREEVDILIEKTIDRGMEATSTRDLRFEVEPKKPSKSSYGRAIDFVYCDYNPPQYKDWFRGPRTMPVKIFIKTLEKIKKENLALYNLLQKQKLSEFDKNSAGKSKEEVQTMVDNFLCLSDIKRIMSKYSGGDELDSVDYLPLRYDIGSEISPDGKPIPIPLDPRFER